MSRSSSVSQEGVGGYSGEGGGSSRRRTLSSHAFFSFSFLLFPSLS